MWSVPNHLWYLLTSVKWCSYYSLLGHVTVRLIAMVIYTHTQHTQTHNHFTALWTLSGTTWMSWYQKVHFAIFWIFWCKRKITQADAPTIGMDCHPIQTNWCPIPAIPTIFTPDALLAPSSQFILVWNRHQICWVAYPVTWLTMVIFQLEIQLHKWGADLHIAQLMPLPLTISCSSKSRLALPEWFCISGAGLSGLSWKKGR